MLCDDKCALVTGGSRGIGAEISLELAREGARVCLTYRKHGDEAEAIVKQICAMGRQALALECDTASFQSAARVVEAAGERLGPIDILVNNAGMNWDGVSWKMAEEQWDRVLDVNLKGTFNFTRHVAPGMKQRGHGSVVNITSINGLRGKFGQGNYSASKAGIIGYTKTVARELGTYDIRVNAVAPGLIETEMLNQSEARRQIVELAQNEMALRRLGTPQDVAWVVAFLVSDKARHITGEVIRVDGGQYI